MKINKKGMKYLIGMLLILSIIFSFAFVNIANAEEQENPVEQQEEVQNEEEQPAQKNNNEQEEEQVNLEHPEGENVITAESPTNPAEWEVGKYPSEDDIRKTMDEEVKELDNIKELFASTPQLGESPEMDRLIDSSKKYIEALRDNADLLQKENVQEKVTPIIKKYLVEEEAFQNFEDFAEMADKYDEFENELQEVFKAERAKSITLKVILIVLAVIVVVAIVAVIIAVVKKNQ